MTTTIEEPVTWEEIIKIEPRLAELLREIKAVKDDKTKRSFCANAVWYGHHGHEGFKMRMYYLVGFRAENPRLRTMHAYDVALTKLYSPLPACRNCMCM